MSRRSITSLLAICLIGAATPATAAAEGLAPPDYSVESEVLDPGAEPWLDLVYDWSPGRRESLVVESWDARTTVYDGRVLEDRTAVPLRVEATVTVESVSGDGVALLETEVDAVSLIDGSATDSDALGAELQTLVGLRVREQVDAKGYLLASETIDPAPDLVEPHPAREGIIGDLEGLTTRLPPGPLGVGGSWQETVTREDPESGVVTTDLVTKTLAGMVGDGLVQLVIHDQANSEPQRVEALEWPFEDGAIVAMDGSAEGALRIDLGRAVQAKTGTGRLTGSLTSSTDESLRFDVVEAMAIATFPAGWSDPSWPTLAPVEVIAIPEGGSQDGIVEPVEPSLELQVLDPGAEPRRVLRYDWEVGQVEHLAVETRMGMRSAVEGEWTPWQGIPPTSMAATTTVTAAHDDGTYEVETIYTDVGVPSGSAAVPPETLEELEAQLSSLVGMTQTLVLDPRGRVLSAETTMPPGAVPGVMQPGQLDAMTEELVEPLPAEPVGEGAVWEVRKTTSDAMGFLAHGVTTTTLTDFEGQDRVRLEGTLTMSADSQPMVSPELPAAVDATVERFKLDGEMAKTVDLGAVNVEASVRSLADYVLTAGYGETVQTMGMQMAMEMDTWLVEPGDGASADSTDSG